MNSGLINATVEKVVLHGSYKPHTINTSLQNLIYVFILNVEKYLRRQGEVVNI